MMGLQQLVLALAWYCCDVGGFQSHKARYLKIKRLTILQGCGLLADEVCSARRSWRYGVMY